MTATLPSEENKVSCPHGEGCDGTTLAHIYSDSCSRAKKVSESIELIEAAKPLKSHKGKK